MPGTPELARTIFGEIDNAAVFVADVTLVAEIPGSDSSPKMRLINPNVAIEYGYAVKAVGLGSVSYRAFE